MNKICLALVAFLMLVGTSQAQCIPPGSDIQIQRFGLLRWIVGANQNIRIQTPQCVPDHDHNGNGDSEHQLLRHLIILHHLQQMNPPTTQPLPQQQPIMYIQPVPQQPQQIQYIPQYRQYYQPRSQPLGQYRNP